MKISGALPASVVADASLFEPWNPRFYGPRVRAVERANPEYFRLAMCNSIGGDYDELMRKAWDDGLHRLHPFYGARFDGPALMTWGKT